MPGNQAHDHDSHLLRRNLPGNLPGNPSRKEKFRQIRKSQLAYSHLYCDYFHCLVLSKKSDALDSDLNYPFCVKITFGYLTSLRALPALPS